MSEVQELAQKTCVPCRGGVPHLDRSEASDLVARVEGWELNADATRVVRRFGFEGFVPAQAFAQRVDALADEHFHYPTITFGWGYCTVTFQIRKIRSLHENDFIMANKVNGLFAEVGGTQ